MRPLKTKILEWLRFYESTGYTSHVGGRALALYDGTEVLPPDIKKHTGSIIL